MRRSRTAKSSDAIHQHRPRRAASPRAGVWALSLLASGVALALISLFGIRGATADVPAAVQIGSAGGARVTTTLAPTTTTPTTTTPTTSSTTSPVTTTAPVTTSTAVAQTTTTVRQPPVTTTTAPVTPLTIVTPRPKVTDDGSGDGSDDSSTKVPSRRGDN